MRYKYRGGILRFSKCAFHRLTLQHTATCTATRTATCAATRNATRTATCTATRTAICTATRTATHTAMHTAMHAATHAATHPPDPLNHVCSLSGSQISGNYFTYPSAQTFKSFAKDQMLQDLILRTRSCVTGFITQHD